MTGQLNRKVADVRPNSIWIDVNLSPDGKWVLISEDRQFAVWSPESDQPVKRLPGDSAVFNPSGLSAVSFSGDKIHWWDTKDWQLHRTINLPKFYGSDLYDHEGPHFVTDEVLEFIQHSGSGDNRLVILRNMPKIIRDYTHDSPSQIRISPAQASRNGRVVVLGGHVYDGPSGQRIPLPRGRRFHPELSQLSEDGRFTPFNDSYIVDLAADKKIDFGDSNPSEWTGEGRFLKELEAWVVLNSDRIYVLRKADASRDPELLRKWCQVITRGKLNERTNFNKLDEAAWEKTRLELAQLLDANPNAQSLRAAVSDPLYWLRQEIEDSESRNQPGYLIRLLDRLIAAEPTWPNYNQRAAAHAEQEHWDLAIQDDFEAARLAGERYWLGGKPLPGAPLNVRIGDVASWSWQVAARSVQAPGRPQEQYERALRWVKARTRAGVDDLKPVDLNHYRPRRTVIAGLALFHLGRYAEALARLRKSDVPMLSEAAGMLMSPWNVLTMMTYRDPARPDFGVTIRTYNFDPVDLLARAMCHHHLGHPKEAKAYLNQARDILPKNAEAIDADQSAFLREAESLIEGKPHP